MMKVRIFTDGAARGNPEGPGGYGAVLLYTDSTGKVHTKELSEGFAKTTNNRMELIAAISALKCLNRPCKVSLYSDSAYLINGFTQGWLVSWKRNGWKNSSKQTVSNIELWQELDRLSGIHEISWIKVKGHADNVYNNRCDALAVAATKKQGEGNHG